MRLTLPAVAVLAVSLASCAPSSAATDRLGLRLRHPVTEQQLRAHPESALLYPQSRLIRRVGADEHQQPGEREPDPGYAGVLATTSATAALLLGWYDQQLTARGYIRGPYYLPSNQVAGGAWTIPRSREQIQVGIYSPAASPAAEAPAGAITYEEILVNYRVTGPPLGLPLRRIG